MKVTLKEMNGLLNGKCLPSDLIVGETLAEYLVRKFTELEQMLAESQREFRAADATIENLQMQAEKLAAENAGLKSIQAWAVADVFKSGAKRFESTKAAGFDTDDCLHDAVLVMLSELKTPATDAFLAEVRASGVESFAESQKEYVRKNRDELDSMTRAAYCGSAVDAERFAAQLRKGVQP
ncbi:TPA: hypothetical protein I3764_000133 [Enterobacter cloacae]|nr:hypothetical protein [Enterobacter cloacae]